METGCRRRKGWKAGILLFGLAVLGAGATGSAWPDAPWSQSQNAGSEEKELPGEGKKFALDGGFSFLYEFVAKPRIGTTVLRLQVFDPAGKQVAPFAIFGRYDMPSMAGAHDSGDEEFRLNAKNNYLLPLHIVMPGEWEVKLTFRRGETVVFRGYFRFNV